MRSTREAARVGSDAVVEAMVTKQLRVRDCLPKAANGLHKAPSAPRCAQILKDMRQGGSKEYARLYCVATTNADDGVPEELAVAPILLLLAAIHEHYQQRERVRADRPLLALITRETKAQQRLDLAELRVANSPTSVEAVDEAIRECEQYEPTFRALADSLRSQRVALASEPAPRRHLTLHGAAPRHTLPMGVTR